MLIIRVMNKTKKDGKIENYFSYDAETPLFKMRDPFRRGIRRECIARSVGGWRSGSYTDTSAYNHPFPLFGVDDPTRSYRQNGLRLSAAAAMFRSSSRYRFSVCCFELANMIR